MQPRSAHRAQPERRSALKHGRLAFLLATLRTLMVLAAFQLSGTAHVAGDLVEMVTLGHHTETNAENEDDPDHDCPPGCPSCHHVHYSGASLPPPAVLRVAAFPMSDKDATDLSPTNVVPQGPDRSSVYRPPRS